MRLNDRIKMLRQKKKLTQKEFAERLGLAQNTIATYESGHRSPMENVILSICREFNVNYDWLKNGTGPMFADQEAATIDLIETVLARENEFTKRVFRSFAKLPDADWEALERLIDAISDQAAGGYSVINDFQTHPIIASTRRYDDYYFALLFYAPKKSFLFFLKKYQKRY